MRGIKRVHGNTTDSRLPITPSLLRSFRSFLNLSYPDHLTLWAAILRAFFAFLRSGELLSLHRSDLHRTADGYQVHIKQSKTDPFRSGAVVTVLPSGDPSLCAVTALDSYLATQALTERTLFRETWPRGAESSHSGTHPTPSASELPQQQPQLASQIGGSKPWAAGGATATGATSACRAARPTALQQP